MINRDDATPRSLTGSKTVAELYFANRYPGYKLKSFGPDEKYGYCFHLEPEDSGVVCPKCGVYHKRFRDVHTAVIYDLDITNGGPIKVILPVRRHRCRCGHNKCDVMPRWVLPNHRVTKQLAAYVQKLLRQNRISISDVAEMSDLDWALVKKLDEASLKPLFQNVDISRCQHLAIDEISIHKNFDYATVFMDLANRQILRVVHGKRKTDLRATFKEFSQLCPGLKSVSVDMNAAFSSLVKEHLSPTVKIAYDLFHVMAHFTKDVLKAARKSSLELINKTFKAIPKKERTPDMFSLRDERRELVKGAEWLVLTDPDLLCGSRRDRLDKLREYNKLFRDLYPLAAMIRAVWKCKDQLEACSMLNAVIELCHAIADEHGFEPIRKFAKMLKTRADGIITAGQVGFGTNILEGANNTAKVIKRIAYGYRDFEYFALKLKAAFPGTRFKLAMQGCCPAWTLYWQDSVETLNFPIKK